MKSKPSFHTLCVKSDVLADIKPHVLPIYSTSSYNFEQTNDSIDVFTGRKQGYVYSRYANPTISAVEKQLASLEGFDLDHPVRALMTSSGMSAIHTLLSALTGPGDSILTQGNLYGGTTELLDKIFRPNKVEIKFLDLNDHNILEAQLDRSKNRQVIYVETPANPTLDCIDIAAVCKMAREYHALVVIDNTFATPYLQRPLTLGADYVIHSTTKYLNGHGNGIGGVIIGRTDETHWDKIWANMKLMGTNCNAFDAWLVHNGLKTLTLRMDRQCENALMVARYLGSHQKVRKVNYPGLEDFHHHHLAQKQMSQYGAMLSFEVDGGREKAIQTIDALKLAKIAPTLGDVDTLVLHPATSSHLNVDRALKEQFGITEGLIRMSIGIESVEDLKEDLNQALK